MFYLIIHLKREEYEEDILLAMASANILDAIVLDGVSAKETMTRALPIFAGFRADVSGKGTYGKVICTTVDDEAVVDTIISALTTAGIDFVRDDLGSIILLPVVRLVASEE